MARSIESEILDVYGAAKRKRDEEDQAYWARLVKASVEGDDDQWNKLNAPAQEWINAGVQAKKNGTEYIPFPDAPAPEPVKEPEPEQDRFRVREVKARPAAEAAPAAEPAPERRRRTRTTTVKKPAPEPVAVAPVVHVVPPAAKVATKRRANGKKPPGVYAQTQEYVVRNPNASTKDIMKALEKKGLTAAQHTVQSVRGHTRDTLKLVQRIKQVDMGIEL